MLFSCYCLLCLCVLDCFDCVIVCFGDLVFVPAAAPEAGVGEAQRVRPDAREAEARALGPVAAVPRDVRRVLQLQERGPVARGELHRVAGHGGAARHREPRGARELQPQQRVDRQYRPVAPRPRRRHRGGVQLQPPGLREGVAPGVARRLREGVSLGVSFCDRLQMFCFNGEIKRKPQKKYRGSLFQC